MLPACHHCNIDTSLFVTAYNACLNMANETDSKNTYDSLTAFLLDAVYIASICLPMAR